MALAHELADAEEVPVGGRVGLDLGHPLGAVGDDVEPRDPLEPLGVDDVRGPLPVVADEQHVAGCGGRRGGEDEPREARREGGIGPWDGL